MENQHLSDSERAQIRGNLRVFMMEHPSRAPLRLRALDRIVSVFAGAQSLVRAPRMQLAGALSLVLVFAGVGTSYAAESALPGDVLYPIKIHLNESVAVALAPSPSARASVMAQHTIRRLQEVEVLAAEGRLSASTSADIQSSLQDSAKNFDANVKEVASAPGGAAAAADLQSNLEVTLSSHARALSVIQSQLPASHGSLAPILQAVVAHAAHAREAEAHDSSLIAASSSIDMRIALKEERRTAQDALAQMRALVAETTKTLGTSSAQAMEQQTSDAQEAVDAGEKNLNEGDAGRALGAYRAAIRAAVQGQADAGVAAHLEKILPRSNATSSAPLEGTTTAHVDMPLGSTPAF